MKHIVHHAKVKTKLHKRATFFCRKMETFENGSVWPLSNILNSHAPISIHASVILLTASIILNVPTLQQDILESILAKSNLKICADGGSNVLYDARPLFSENDSVRDILPDVIIGDLDSIRDDVRAFYESSNVEIVLVEDQDSTDLDKALAYAAGKVTETSLVAVIGTIGAHEGRIDQLFAVINSMYKYRNSLLRLIQIGKESVVMVLPEGKHLIEIPPTAVNRHCGLVPLFGPVRELTTSGLEWNVDPSMGPLSFGSFVSTNNIIRAKTIEVKSSDPVLFTMTYR